MAAKNLATRSLNLATLAGLFTDESKAREFLESKLWPDGVVCPHCESKEVYVLTAKEESKSPVRPGVYKCKICRKQFTVRIGTIFEESPLPLSKWLMAIHLMTSSKKGISSHQIARELGITQKSAWFLDHRIREAMTQEPMAGMLEGTNATIAENARQEEKFNRLAAAWKRDTVLLSKTSAKVLDMAYQKIIGMGPAAVPFILRDLKDNGPNHWFWALYAITEENPASRQTTGNIAAMTEAWIQWGRKKGYRIDCLKSKSESSQT